MSSMSDADDPIAIRFGFKRVGPERACPAIVCNLIGTVFFFLPAALERGSIRIAACVLCIVGIWIEKGMGLIVPGFIPSTLHEIVEYTPSHTEWKVSAGIWHSALWY